MGCIIYHLNDSLCFSVVKVFSIHVSFKRQHNSSQTFKFATHLCKKIQIGNLLLHLYFLPNVQIVTCFFKKLNRFIQTSVAFIDFAVFRRVAFKTNYGMIPCLPSIITVRGLSSKTKVKLEGIKSLMISSSRG